MEFGSAASGDKVVIALFKLPTTSTDDCNAVKQFIIEIMKEHPDTMAAINPSLIVSLFHL